MKIYEIDIKANENEINNIINIGYKNTFKTSNGNDINKNEIEEIKLYAIIDNKQTTYNLSINENLPLILLAIENKKDNKQTTIDKLKKHYNNIYNK